MDNRIEETKKLLNELQEGITLLDSIKDEFKDCALSRKEFNIEFYNFFSKCNERITWKPSEDFDLSYKKLPEYRKVERIYTDTLNLIERKKTDFENDLKFLIETDENSEYYERELLLFEISEIEKSLSMWEDILEVLHEYMCEVKNINKENTILHEENEKRYNQYRFDVNEEKSLLNEKKKKLEEITFFLKEKKASLAKIELEKEQEEIRKHELEKIRLEQEHELKKMALQLQIEETKLLREREEREAIHSSIQELHNTIKEKN